MWKSLFLRNLWTKSLKKGSLIKILFFSNSLGDLDNDGYGDFAVGAPFEDNGSGVVRLFFGRKDIEYIDIKGSNIIRARPGQMGFGASFSKKSIDIDSNQLSDFAIGSYLSSEVTILRRLASVWAEIDVTPSITSIDIGNRKRK